MASVAGPTAKWHCARNTLPRCSRKDCAATNSWQLKFDPISPRRLVPIANREYFGPVFSRRAASRFTKNALKMSQLRPTVEPALRFVRTMQEVLFLEMFMQVLTVVKV